RDGERRRGGSDRARHGRPERAGRGDLRDRPLERPPRRVGRRAGGLDHGRERELELRPPLLDVERDAAERPGVAPPPDHGERRGGGGHCRRGDDETSHLERERDQQVGGGGDQQDGRGECCRPEDGGAGDGTEQHRARATDTGDRRHSPLPISSGTVLPAVLRWSSSAASAKASAAPNSHGASVDRITSGCGRAPAATAVLPVSPASAASLALSSGAAVAAPAQVRGRAAARRAKRGWSTRSPRDGTSTVTVRMQPAPCATATAAGPPSRQRATTRAAPAPPPASHRLEPGPCPPSPAAGSPWSQRATTRAAPSPAASSYAAQRSNGATTATPPAVSAPTVSGAARAIQGAGTAGAAALSGFPCVAGQWTRTRAPSAAHAESAAFGVPRTTRTLLEAESPAPCAPASATRSGSSGSPTNATTAGAAESARAVTRTSRTPPGQSARIESVARSTASAVKGEMIASSMESARSRISDAVRSAAISATESRGCAAERASAASESGTAARSTVAVESNRTTASPSAYRARTLSAAS